MNRLLVLIVEVEQPEGLSSRKLLIESMKHNVVTAYSGSEAIQLLNRMRPDIVLVHRHLQTPSCAELLISMKQLHPQVPVAVMSPNAERCSIEDYQVNSLEPARLVKFFQQFSQQVIGTQPADHPSTRTVSAYQEAARS